MSVRFRNGRYIIDYYPLGYKGKRTVFKTQPGTTEADALAIEKELRARRDKNKTINLDPLSTINRLSKAYLIDCSMHQSPETARDKRSHFKKHIVPFFGSLHINQLTNAHITAYKGAMQKKTYVVKTIKTKDAVKKIEKIISNKTIIKGLNYFSAFLKWCEDEHQIKTDVPLRFRRLPYSRPIPKVLSLEEAIAFINAADKVCRSAYKCHHNTHCPHKAAFNVLFKIYFYLGIRNRAGRCLCWDDVDWTKHAIKTLEKGNKEKWHPLPDDLREDLRILYVQQSSGSKYIFPSATDKSKPIKKLFRAVQRARNRAGIKKRVYPHLLRHSIATHLVDTDIDLRVIQSFLDHSQITTTEWYTQVSIEKKRQALEKAGLKSTKGV